MRRTDNGLPVVDVLLEFRQKICPRIVETVQRIWALPIKYANVMLKNLKRALDLPGMVPGVIVVGRDRDDDSSSLGSLEQAAEIWNDVMLHDAFTDDRPRFAFRTHEIDLRIDNN